MCVFIYLLSKMAPKTWRWYPRFCSVLRCYSPGGVLGGPLAHFGILLANFGPFWVHFLAQFSINLDWKSFLFGQGRAAEGRPCRSSRQTSSPSLKFIFPPLLLFHLPPFRVLGGRPKAALVRLATVIFPRRAAVHPWFFTWLSTKDQRDLSFPWRAAAPP